MKTIAALFFPSMLFISTGMYGQAADNPSREIRQLEEMERTAELKGDTAALFSYWSPNYVVNNPNNMILMAAQIKSFIRKGGIAKTSFTRDIEKITFSGALAIVMGSETYDAKENKNQPDNPVTRRFTNVWVKTEKGWLLAARQASNMITQ